MIGVWVVSFVIRTLYALCLALEITIDKKTVVCFADHIKISNTKLQTESRSPISTDSTC